MNWLIITTENLPEAFVMAGFLLEQSQEVAVFNIQGRPLKQRMQVLKRLAKKRGLGYLMDLLRGRRCRKRYLDPTVRIFPDITGPVIADIQSRCRCIDIDNPNGEEAVQQVAQINPDYILLLGAPVIKPPLFTLARHGTLNWHHGLSPRYRGSDCVLWAMANNDFDQIGFTIHFVSEIVDGGKIILQRKIAVRKDVGFGEAIADVARQGMNGFVEVVDRVVSGQDLIAQEQEKGGTHYPPIGLRAIRQAYRNFTAYAGQ